MQKIGTQQLFTVFPSCKDISSVRSQLCLSSFGAYFYEFSGCYNSPMDSFEEFEPRKLPLNTPMPVSLSTRAITTRQFFLFCTLYFTSLLLLLLPVLLPSTTSINRIVVCHLGTSVLSMTQTQRNYLITAHCTNDYKHERIGEFPGSTPKLNLVLL